MKTCFICDGDSAASTSVEHVIPESLGNSSLVLPPGVICDGCNNYFASKVEKPFLESEALVALRFSQGLVSKKGRIPLMLGTIEPGDATVEMRRHPRNRTTEVRTPSHAFERLRTEGTGSIAFRTEAPWPQGNVLSRFVAKVALGALAARLLAKSELLDKLRQDPLLAPLRDHARRGKGRWGVHVRRLYPANARTTLPDGSRHQVIHESEFLMTADAEMYFALVLFGTEFTINVGGPSLDGYRDWLAANGGASPVYGPKHADMYPMPT